MNEYPSMPRLPLRGPSVQAQATRSESRPWGNWTVLYEDTGIKVKLIEVTPGCRLSLQYHHHRSEFWLCLGGRATAVVGDQARELCMLESVVIPVGCIHRLGNPGPEPVLILEIQRGEVLAEEDIVRLEDDYHRVIGPGRL